MNSIFRILCCSGLLLLSGLLRFQPARSQEGEGVRPPRPGKAASPGLVLMCLSAHPDDEDGATLAYYARLKGVTSYSIFFTRGEGGQNEIGSELGEELGAIRTNETLEAARILGSEVHFLGFPDFGFSKSAKETFRKWGGRDSVVTRLVWCIRALKPDIVITSHDTITTKPNRQHGNHQAAGISVYEAFAKAADPTFHPEQLSDTVGPWQVRKLYFRNRSQDSAALKTLHVVDIDISASATGGSSIGDLAFSALQKHRSQGLDKLARSSIPEFFRRHRFVLVRSDAQYPFDAHDLFSGIKPSVRTPGILPQAKNDLPPFSIRVSPEVVPRTGSATFVVALADRRGHRFDRCELLVSGGGRALFRKEYASGTVADTLHLTFDSAPARPDSALIFRADAISRNDTVSSEFTVRRISVQVNLAPPALVGLVGTYDNTDEETLRSLGIPFRLIDSSQLAVGDLDRYASILLDLRAYAYRPDAAAHNDRLLEYVRKGGNVICLYQKPGDLNGKHYSPYPILITGERVTEEDASVRVLLPRHPLLTRPNEIRPHDWDGWVQERSIYLPSGDTLQTSPEYERILSMNDENDEQPPTSLLCAQYGRGSYTYVSLALYRQLRILQAGAVKLFVNLVSQPRH